MRISIKDLVRPNVQSLRAYEAREIPCKVKLDANESPVGIPAAEAERIGRLLGRTAFHRYPDPQATRLRSRIGRKLGVTRDQVLLGNGSDELISLLIATFGGPVLFPVPTFSMYGILSRAHDAECIEIPLVEESEEKKFGLDIKKIRAAIRKQKPRLVFLSVPNNPTGNRFDPDHIVEIIRISPGIVVVDEAYQPFAGGKGFLPLLKRFENLVILRTLSKVGLASLRLGILASSPEIVSEVDKVRLPFNVNTLSQVVAEEALASPGLLSGNARLVARERKKLFRSLSKIPGIRVYPSDANFLLFRVDDAPDVHAKLLKLGVLIKNLDGVIPGCLRVTVGTPEENSLFLEALTKALGKKVEKK